MKADFEKWFVANKPEEKPSKLIIEGINQFAEEYAKQEVYSFINFTEELFKEYVNCEEPKGMINDDGMPNIDWLWKKYINQKFKDDEQNKK
jgi:hypothetical protein